MAQPAVDEHGHNPAATTPAELTHVLRAIRGMPSPVTRTALLLCCYLAQRPGNIVAMRWDQLDERGHEWTLPAEAMKTRRSHVVPLPWQAVELLESLKPLSGGVGFVFPPLARQRNRYLTRDTLSKALRDAGLRNKQTPHGLGATFRTVARERLGINEDVLEAQLAHAKHGAVQATPDRTGFIKQRHCILQRWADYLDTLERDQVAYAATR